MKRTTLFIILVAMCHIAFGRSQRSILEKGSSIYVESKNAAEKIHLEKVLEYRGIYNIVDKPEKASYIVKVISKGGVNYRAYAQIIDRGNDKIIQTTPKVNTFWSITFNPKLKAMKKLARKRLRCSKNYNS